MKRKTRDDYRRFLGTISIREIEREIDVSERWSRSYRRDIAIRQQEIRKIETAIERDRRDLRGQNARRRMLRNELKRRGVN